MRFGQKSPRAHFFPHCKGTTRRRLFSFNALPYATDKVETISKNEEQHETVTR